jgi:hypothetical protein
MQNAAELCLTAPSITTPSIKYTNKTKKRKDGRNK